MSLLKVTCEVSQVSITHLYPAGRIDGIQWDKLTKLKWLELGNNNLSGESHTSAVLQ
jgi:hypothetical protein